MRKLTRTLVVITALGLAAAAPVAAAEPVVLQVEDGLAYIDLGAVDGVGEGTELELVREVVVRDPVSGATLRDKFTLGSLVVLKAGERVCQAEPAAALAGRVRAGDEIRLSSEKRTFADPWAEQVAASKQPAIAAASAPAVVGPGADRAAATRAVEEATAARAVWTTTLGQPPATRAAAWRAFLAERPATPYAAAIRAEIASLERQAQALDAAEAAARTPAPVIDRRRALGAALAALVGEARGPLWAAAPTRVAPGRPIAMAFAVRARVAGAPWLYVRPAGADAFQRLALIADGDDYLRATIPAELVRGPRVEWYVEIGEDQPVVGRREAPRAIAVEADVAEPPPQPGRTQIALRLDYVDFDGGFEQGHDQYRQLEAEFAYRFLRPVHTVRVGFGSLAGTGGPKDVIDADPMGTCRDEQGTNRCRSVDFTYVYTEFELRIRRVVAVMIRPQAGLLTTNRPQTDAMASDCRNTGDPDRISDCEFFTGVGLRGRLRLGDEQGTHLILGAAFTEKVGTMFEAAYNWAPRYEFPIHLAVQVTDLPVPEDLGVRLITEVGWREHAWVYPSLRLSYQARDIDHVGVSGGLGLNFDW